MHIISTAAESIKRKNCNLRIVDTVGLHAHNYIQKQGRFTTTLGHLAVVRVYGSLTPEYSEPLRREGDPDAEDRKHRRAHQPLES